MNNFELTHSELKGAFNLDGVVKKYKQLIPLPFIAVTFSVKGWNAFVNDEWFKVNKVENYRYICDMQVYEKQEADYIIWHNKEFFELYHKMALSKYVTAEKLKDFITKKEDE